MKFSQGLLPSLIAGWQPFIRARSPWVTPVLTAFLSPLLWRQVRAPPTPGLGVQRAGDYDRRKYFSIFHCCVFIYIHLESGRLEAVKLSGKNSFKKYKCRWHDGPDLERGRLAFSPEVRRQQGNYPMNGAGS